MTIVLLHRDYDVDHLSEVIAEMKEKGAPVIRAYHDDADDVYFAVEGCHRIRAAKKLGLTPTIQELEWDKEYQNPDTDDILTANQLLSNYNYTEVIDFDEF